MDDYVKTGDGGRACDRGLGASVDALTHLSFFRDPKLSLFEMNFLTHLCNTANCMATFCSLQSALWQDRCHLAKGNKTLGVWVPSPPLCRSRHSNSVNKQVTSPAPLPSLASFSLPSECSSGVQRILVSPALEKSLSPFAGRLWTHLEQIISTFGIRIKECKPHWRNVQSGEGFAKWFKVCACTFLSLFGFGTY